MKKLSNITLIFTLGLVLLAACNRVVIKVENIPANTPAGQPIYITGNFNNWDPGENRYQLTLGPDSAYYYTLPPGFGQVDYKFSRGDWTTVEKGICGEEIDNRSLNTNAVDTAIVSIASWNDLDPINCPKLTIVIDNIPENTPEEDIIAIASNLNSWDPDNASISKKTASGERYITINRPPGVSKLEYKLTRGDLSTSESDEFGNELPNRTLEFGKSDTIRVSVQGWTDQNDNRSQNVVLILNHLPENTPPADRIFLASNLNSWISGDKNYEFQRNNKGQLFYRFPRKKIQLDYKITRGGWNTVEVDKNGYDISNRQINLENADTVYLDIKRWKDVGKTGDDDITIVIEHIPATTPQKAKIYISGNFNDWDPGRLRYLFWEGHNGTYYINLPRRNGDIEFRITRGSWETAQIDAYGSDMTSYLHNYNDFDTLFLQIENWKDLPTKPYKKTVTIVIDKKPKNTPTYAAIYLAPDFNGWNPGDDRLIFDRLADGRPVITIPVHDRSMQYKITRGGWNTAEVNALGQEIENRILYLGFADTVHVDIAKWRDL